MRSLTVLYDAGCPICRAARRWLAGRPQVVPLEFVYDFGLYLGSVTRTRKTHTPGTSHTPPRTPDSTRNPDTSQ